VCKLSLAVIKIVPKLSFGLAVFIGIKSAFALQFAEAMNDITGLAVKSTHPVFLTLRGVGGK